MILGTIYVVWIAADFLGPFQAFLITLGVPIAAWCGYFLGRPATSAAREYAEADLYDPRGRYGRSTRSPSRRWSSVPSLAGAWLRPLHAASAGRGTCSARSGWAAEPGAGHMPT